MTSHLFSPTVVSVVEATELMRLSSSTARLDFINVGGPGEPPLGDCVKDTLGGVPIEEHDGRVLTNPEQLVPFSLAQWITQTTQPSVTDRHGPSVLRSAARRCEYQLVVRRSGFSGLFTS